MSTTNPVYSVLPTSGNQAILAAGSRVDALNNGQLGIFNVHTGLSIDGTDLKTANDIFIAVGINTTTGGTDDMEDFRKSAGQVIQVRNARSLTVKGYVAEIQKVITITGFGAKCDTDYAVKFTVDSIAGQTTNGYNQMSKTYGYRTGCCLEVDCDTCPQGDPIELAVGLVNNINADVEAVFIASLYGNKMLATIGDPTTDGTAVIGVGTELINVPLLAADTATLAAAKVAAAINASTTSGYVASSTGAIVTVYPKKPVGTPTALITLSSAGGTGVTVGTTSNVNTAVAVTDTDAFKAAYPNAGLGIKVTTNAETRPAGGDINVLYHKAVRTFTVSLLDGFGCNGTVTTTTEYQAAEGKAYDLDQLEYVAQGWLGDPYRTRAVTGFARPQQRLTVAGTNYNAISLAYDQESVAGWFEYKNNLETIIAIPCADNTTLTGLFTVLDRIFVKFPAKSDDVADMDCTNTNVSTINNYALDGMSSLM